MSKNPSHSVYYVREGERKNDDRWIEVGAAWQNQDGKGFSLQLDAVPIDFDGRLVVRAREPKPATRPDDRR